VFKKVKKNINAGIIDRIKEATGQKKNKEDKIVLIDADALGAGSAEPDMRIVGLFSDVQEEKVAELVQAILYLNELNKAEEDEEKKKPIDFYICTYGGSADDMFALYDIINIVKQDTEIHTIGVGKVMSAGVLLLASGTQGKRKIGKHCRVMIHNVIGGNHGSLPNLTNELEAIQTLQDDYVNALVANTKLTKKKLTKMLNEKVNVYLSAEEAVELGIADIII
jgi:ATP-dependent Clp protease protease subunit